MNVAHLVPSLSGTFGDDPDPAGAPTPNKAITVLTGSGASLSAGAPSTNDLTELLAGRSIAGEISAELRAAKGLTTFEEILHVLEELEAMSEGKAAPLPTLTLLPFLSPRGFVSKLGRGDLLKERLKCIEAMADAFSAVDYDAAWRLLYPLLRRLLSDYNVQCYTLNYDLIADVTIYALSIKSTKPWYTGFPGKPTALDLTSEFRPDQYVDPTRLGSPLYLTLAHLHGSLSYAYRWGDERRAHGSDLLIVEAGSLAGARDNWRAFHDFALDKGLDDGFGLRGVSPIISGLRKSEKLNLRPYGEYLHSFVQSLSQNAGLLIIGYGGNDPHVNFWIEEYLEIHRQAARVIEITTARDPKQFLLSQHSAHNLGWAEIASNVYRNEAYGVRGLTFTGGVGFGVKFPLDQIMEHLQ